MPLTSSFDSPTKVEFSRNSSKEKMSTLPVSEADDKIEVSEEENLTPASNIEKYVKGENNGKAEKPADDEKNNTNGGSPELMDGTKCTENTTPEKKTLDVDLNSVTSEKVTESTTVTKDKPVEKEEKNVDNKKTELNQVEKQNPTDTETEEKETCKEEDMDMSPASPVTMPKRGKKRGRSPEPSSETPNAKKRMTHSDDEKKQNKVSHQTHPDFSLPGVVLTLGEGDVGQLGLGEDIIERSRPAHVKLEDKIVQVSAGGMHTVCLTNKGKIYTFGCNDESALGRDTSEEGSETLPVRLNLSYKIVQTSAGDSHTAVLTEDGHVYAWGNFRDASGSMGLTSNGISTEPLEMLPGETVIKIVSGGDHLVCLTDKGEIFTGGCAEQGQLGRVAECFAGRGGRKGLDSILKMGPVRCKKHNSRKRATFSDIWAGQYVTFAKEKESGDIYSWGLNNYYQLGFGDMQNRFVPEWVSSFAAHSSKFIKVQAGQHHTMLLDEEGKVFTLGRAEYGRLGLGENPGERSEPALVKGLGDNKCIDIAAGQSVSFALMENGSVYGWGMGTSKQLGTGDEEDVWVPVKMGGKQLENRVVVSLAAGGQHTVLLAKDKS